jgi:hypothetical protein
MIADDETTCERFAVDPPCAPCAEERDARDRSNERRDEEDAA